MDRGFDFMRRFGIFVFVMGCIGASSVLAANEAKRWVITEDAANGGHTLLVIDEDPSLRDDPTRLSQRVVFKRRYAADETAAFETARLRFQAQAGPGKETPRLPARGEPLWVAVKDEWTTEDEAAYSRWFAENAGRGFLSGTGLAADCADVGLVFRWVYAREHRLPIANSLAGSGKLFGHFTGSSAWDRLPRNRNWRRDERFKAALRELFDETYTVSINTDQYPTVIDREHVRPGSMYMILRPRSGHTQTISSLTDGEGIRAIWGNEPAAPRIYESSLIVEYGVHRGFRNWRHVRRGIVEGVETWTLVAAAEMPGYSREQFETGATSGDEWMTWVYARLGYRFNDEERLGIFAKSFAQSIDFRRSLVSLAAFLCGPESPCSPAGDLYDQYSTFSRDARLKDLRDEIRALIVRLGSGHPAVLAAMRALKDRGEVAWESGVGYLDALTRDGEIEKWGADPNISFAARWGLSGASSPSQRFVRAADALLGALTEREDLVNDAQVCRQARCEEASRRTWDTSRIDGRIAAFFPRFLAAAGDPGVESGTLERVRSAYRGRPLRDVFSDKCLGGVAAEASCTADDVIFGEGAAARISRWTSGPNDLVLNRWGL